MVSEWLVVNNMVDKVVNDGLLLTVNWAFDGYLMTDTC